MGNSEQAKPVETEPSKSPASKSISSAPPSRSWERSFATLRSWTQTAQIVERANVRECLRGLAQTSLYFLCKAILGFKDMTPTFHGPLCLTLDTIPTDYARLLDLWPRGTLKTHIITIGKSIQYYLRNPNVRVCLIGSNADNAKKNLGAIKRQFESNVLLHWLFPECVPNPKSDTWKTTEITLPRPSSRIVEPTYKAIGWGTRITGWHFDVLVKDDLIDEHTEKSPEVMEAIINWHSLSKYLLEGSNKGVDHLIGTRWLLNDVYGYVQEKEPEYLVTKVGIFNPDGTSVWEERHPRAHLVRERAKDSVNFSCQMLNEPTAAGSTAFHPDWLKYYSFNDVACENLVMTV